MKLRRRKTRGQAPVSVGATASAEARDMTGRGKWL